MLGLRHDALQPATRYHLAGYQPILCVQEDPAMRRFALLFGFALSCVATSAVAQCYGFTDVSLTSPFCNAVGWLKTYGITEGCTTTTFCPNENVTRLQM